MNAVMRERHIDMDGGIDVLFKSRPGRWPMLAAAWVQKKPALSINIQWLHGDPREAEFNYAQIFRQPVAFARDSDEYALNRRAAFFALLDDIESTVFYGVRTVTSERSVPLSFMGGYAYFGGHGKVVVGPLRWLSAVDEDGVPSHSVFVLRERKDEDLVEFRAELSVEFHKVEDR